MRKIIILVGIIWSVPIVSGLQAQTKNSPAIGEMEIKIKGLEDKSIYAKTRVVKLKNLLASEIEPFIRARLSIYGAV